MTVTRVHGCTCACVKLLEISAANYQTPVIVTARQSDGSRRYCGCCRPCVRLSDLFRRVRGAHNYHRDDTAAAFCWRQTAAVALKPAITKSTELHEGRYSENILRLMYL